MSKVRKGGRGDRRKMALTENDIAEMLIKLKEKMPDIYRHIMGMIRAVVKMVK